MQEVTPSVEAHCIRGVISCALQIALHSALVMQLISIHWRVAAMIPYRGF